MFYLETNSRLYDYLYLPSLSMISMGTDAGWSMTSGSEVTKVSIEINCSLSISSRRLSMIKMGTMMEVMLELNVSVTVLAIKSGSPAAGK